MMGFGGGTGTPNAPFGSSNSNNQQQPTSGFGAQQPSAFGNSAPAPTSNANASFGTSQSYGGFGGAQSPSSHPFGGGSGGTGSGFGNNTSPPPTQFGQQAYAAQTPAPAPGMTFGSSSSMGPFGSSTSNTQATTGGGFGQPSFATSAPSTGIGFGSTSATFGGSSGFGAQAPSAGFDTTSYGISSGVGGGFGAASPDPFRSAPPTQSSSYSNPPNPFGAASTTPASAVTFGSSSNVVATSGFGNSSDSDMFTGSPMPYGFNSPMHQHSDSDDMGGDDHYQNRGGQQQTPSSNLPFGTPAATNTSTWGAPSSTFGGQSSSTFRGQSSLSPIPETGQHGRSPFMAKAEEVPSAEDDKLATLKARIEEKKRRLEESKRKKEAAAREAATASTPSPPVPAEVRAKPLSAAAPAFAPGPAFAGALSATESQSLAEKNAVRFSSNNNSESIRSHMPAELRAMAEGNKSDYASHRTDEREDPQVLKNAVSLIGTCMHMCPDEELLRREREGDVQLLEIPQPGKLHPADWTLRNTVVKRFRRSAADYKLDVPDWVRPPDVLEKVCSYLEEWVMVRQLFAFSS
jgi:nuclear pore complex protein Nup98-Nup96